jgi:hypothetical protein
MTLLCSAFFLCMRCALRCVAHRIIQSTQALCIRCHLIFKSCQDVCDRTGTSREGVCGILSHHTVSVAFLDFNANANGVGVLSIPQKSPLNLTRTLRRSSGPPLHMSLLPLDGCP